jgi:uncharacterized protein YcnI
MKHPLIVSLLAGASAGAWAHVSLEQDKAAAGSSYKAVFRIGHGCDGSATHTVSVNLPAGFRGAKPMPKPGWTLSVRKAPLAQSYESHGRTISDDVVEVSWKAASREAWLADAHYDEFTLRGQLPATPQALWFKVQQLCERGELHWTEVPASGTSTRGLKAPAVLLEVLPAETKAHSH